MSDLATYLAGLKAGDVVHVFWHGRCLEKTIERLTPTQIITGSDRFKRDTGWLIRKSGSRRSVWSRYPEPYIMSPDKAEEVKRANDRQETLYLVRKTLSDHITLTTIPLMRVALDEAEAVLREAGE